MLEHSASLFSLKLDRKKVILEFIIISNLLKDVLYGAKHIDLHNQTDDIEVNISLVLFLLTFAYNFIYSIYNFIF